MIQKELTCFHLGQIAESGQCFRMVPCAGEENSFTIVSGNHVLKAAQDGKLVTFFCGDGEFPFWEKYFDLTTDYDAFRGAINPKDAYLKRAAEFGQGIRILRQDPWEMIITFIISQQKTIPAIRSLVEALCRKYGTRLPDPDWLAGAAVLDNRPELPGGGSDPDGGSDPGDGSEPTGSSEPGDDSGLGGGSDPADGSDPDGDSGTGGSSEPSGGSEPGDDSGLGGSSGPSGGFYAFPTPDQLSAASLDDLLALKLGYRAKYIKQVCQDACEGRLDLAYLKTLPYDDAMEYLKGFYGIGKKVANCICLFGLHHIDAFPVDTWIKKILLKEYAPKTRLPKDLPQSKVCDFLIKKHFSRYRGFAGVMQQYIFHYERETAAAHRPPSTTGSRADKINVTNP